MSSPWCSMESLNRGSDQFGRDTAKETPDALPFSLPCHPCGRNQEGLDALANDSAQLVWSVVGLARLPDGRVAVLSSENQQLLLFEPSIRRSSRSPSGVALGWPRPD